MTAQEGSPPRPPADPVPVSPSLRPTLQAAHVPTPPLLVDRGVVLVSLLAIALGAVAALVAQVLMALIGLITNLSFYGTLSTRFSSPAGNHLGFWVVLIPVVGGLIVGVMARYGSKMIRGHGIPEAMQSVLISSSRIPPRVTLLKPLSAAIAIGTGGPFGAEGPIIATGGALGSLLGQVLGTTTAQRKTLLAAGAAAGMAATFGSPIAAVLLALELLLFEFRARSIIPVALAASSATSVRIIFNGTAPMFRMPTPHQLTLPGLFVYIAMGLVLGVAAAWITRGVFAVGDLFERIPLHWMWWPAIGAVAVGLIGFVVPQTLGVGYDNIQQTLAGQFTLQAVAVLAIAKLLSWTIALSSGTSGGTLAPLFTIGGGLGTILGLLAAWLLPSIGLDVHVAALIGMAAIFAGASRALLTSIIFALETTHQAEAAVPLMAGCSAAFLISAFLTRYSLMTQPIVRRGIRVPTDYYADPLEYILVRDVAIRAVTCLRADQTLAEASAWLASGQPAASHQGFPIVDAQGVLVGVLTRRDLRDPAQPGNRRLGNLVQRPPVITFESASVREAVLHMAAHQVGRLPVVREEEPGRVVGIITRNDVLTAYRHGLEEQAPTPSELSILDWFHWRARRPRPLENAAATHDDPGAA